MVPSLTNHRKSLRERCPIPLTITPISYRDWNKVHNCNCELILVFEEEEHKMDAHDQQHHTPHSSRSRYLAKASHLVEIIPGLHIALLNNNSDVARLRTLDGKPFTHIVQVSYITPIGNGSLSRSNWRRKEAPRSARVQRLGLVCPVASLRLHAEQTAVGPHELHAARDFLSLALPYGSTKWWPEEQRKGGQGEWHGRRKYDARNEQDEGQDADGQVVVLAPDLGLDDLLLEESNPVIHDDEEDEGVNVLIVAPRRRAVDVLSVLFCYLAFLEGTTPEDLVDYRDRVWRKVRLGPWSKSYVELIATCD